MKPPTICTKCIITNLAKTDLEKDDKGNIINYKVQNKKYTPLSIFEYVWMIGIRSRVVCFFKKKVGSLDVCRIVLHMFYVKVVTTFFVCGSSLLKKDWCSWKELTGWIRDWHTNPCCNEQNATPPPYKSLSKQRSSRGKSSCHRDAGWRHSRCLGTISH